MSGSTATINESNPVFIPATEWSLLPYQVRLEVISYLPLRDRVICERVNMECKKISNELFANQKKIYIDTDEYEYSISPYWLLASKCPNLNEFSFYPSAISDECKQDMILNLYDHCPLIRSFRFIEPYNISIVMSYLVQYKKSSSYVEGSFKKLYMMYDDRMQTLMLYELINYKLSHIEFPPTMSDDHWIGWGNIAENIPYRGIKSIGSLYMTDEISVKRFRGILNYLLVQNYDNEDENIQKNCAINLENFYGIIDQENFDNLCKCINLKMLYIHWRSYVPDITNLINLINLKFFAHYMFESSGIVDEKNREIFINFLCQNGEKLRDIGISLATPVEPILDAIRINCPRLIFLRVFLESKGGMMNIIPRMKSLKYISIFRVKLSQEEIDTIRESLPRLIRFNYRLEGDNDSDEDDDQERHESNENGKYFPYHIFITLAIFLFIRAKT